jgi:multidrug efflux pump subunit AcrA (membrane-fusion protein)
VTTQGLATQAALASLEQAKATLKQTEAGAWRYEVQEAQAQVTSAQAALKELQVQLAQATVRSPVAGTVLQVNTRVGEFVAAMPPGNSLGAGEDSAVLVGALTPLQVRVDVDEVTATYLKLGAPAVGVLKGNADLSFPLRYVRLQPLMVPKRSLTGSTAERVDVRVLQLIYEMDQPKDFPVYVGQQVEVFLQDTRSTKPATAPIKRTGGDKKHLTKSPILPCNGVVGFKNT